MELAQTCFILCACR